MNHRRSAAQFVAALAVSLASTTLLVPASRADAETAPKFTGSQPLPPLPEGAFTVVVIPDTQHYIGKDTKISRRNGRNLEEPVTNAHLDVQTAWIVANRDAQHIVFVTHVGDIVEDDRPQEWAVARQHLDRLRGVVPFGLTVGNHDMSPTGDAHFFQEHFSAASFRQYPWYVGSYEHDREAQFVSANNVNSAQLFSAGGRDFIHLNLECNAPDDVLAWADAVLHRHAARRAIVTTHMDLGVLDKPKEAEGFSRDPKGVMRWVKIHGAKGNSAEQMWEKFYRRQPNLDFILSGDQSRVTALRVERQADDGHPVRSLLSDYQSEPVLRLMRFLPKENRVAVLSYEVMQNFVIEDTEFVHDREQHQFSLDYDLSRRLTNQP